MFGVEVVNVSNARYFQDMLCMELGVPNVTRFCSALLYARNRVSNIFKTIFCDLVPEEIVDEIYSK